MLLTVAVLVLAPTAAIAQQPSACRTASPDDLAAGALEFYRQVVSGSEELDSIGRARIPLPRLPATAVVFVTDIAVCRRAMIAYNAELEESHLDLPVTVLRVGTQYLVLRPASNPNYLPMQILFTADFSTVVARINGG